VLPQTSPALVQSELRSNDAAPTGGPATAERAAEPRSSASSASQSAQQNRQYAQAPAPRTAAAPAVASPLLGFDTFGPGARRDQQIRIVADEKNNALIIYAKPRDYRMIQAAVRRLDVVPQQVMIEATIVEVTLNDNLRYGLQWFFRSGNFEATLSQSVLPTISTINPGFNFTYSGGSARAILSALAEVTDLNVVSSPQVLVLDHQTAILQVGDQVPVPVQQAQSVTDPAAPIVNSIEYRDTGVILRVTPRVNATGQIILEIIQEVSDVVRTTTSDLNAPTISQRRIVSTVSVQNGATVALGGLIRDGSTRSRTGVPILSEIPVVGLLFSERRLEKSRTELLVMLTPRAIRNPAEARDITEEMRQRLTNIRTRWPR
jgi:general secretion pathway protein D